ncbi:AAA family ATPase [Bradyrhizobium liaoningense]|uniref:AAA family ATPase n=1 Tax=Bradyrhizobium liaoningense TaxID=43992 RepID=UPI001BAD59EB|nr:AAA family ATPase [Bradyrhizobium liaoningense]MBR0941566.1 AAA family ATPase [Bradyrhizobium liaoningense]
MPPPSLAWPASADLAMSRDGPFRSRPPLTPIETARRTAALKEQKANRTLGAAAAPEMRDELVAVNGTAAPEPNDEFDFGARTARILRNCRRDVALAPDDTKKIVFQRIAKKLGEAVAGQWLPRTVMIDRLLDIAVTHSSFGLDPDQIQKLIADAVEEIDVPQTSKAAIPPKRRLITHRASDLQPEKLVWVWQGRIPEGKLVLIGGPPGLGKSQLTAFIAATISNGGDWPSNEGSTAVGNVIFMSAEDGIADTIVPRLMAAGANLERVHIVASATKPDGTGRKTFSLKTDVDLLEAKAKEIGDVRLIIVDPISAYMGGSDGNGNVETREVLEPLAEMANRLHIAVVAVTHLNKGSGGGNQTALNRFSGSIAFIAAARAAFAVLEDPENNERRFLLQAKNNLGPTCKGLVFRMEQRLLSEGLVSSNIIFFENEQVSQSIDEALTASENRGGDGSQTSAKEDVAEFLSEILAAGPVDVLEVERQARLAGLLGDTKRIRETKSFRAARKHLSILSRREGFGQRARYVLSLPGLPCAPKESMGAQSREGAHMGNGGAHDVGEEPECSKSHDNVSVLSISRKQPRHDDQ